MLSTYDNPLGDRAFYGPRRVNASRDSQVFYISDDGSLRPSEAPSDHLAPFFPPPSQREPDEEVNFFYLTMIGRWLVERKFEDPTFKLPSFPRYAVLVNYVRELDELLWWVPEGYQDELRRRELARVRAGVQTRARAGWERALSATAPPEDVEGVVPGAEAADDTDVSSLRTLCGAAARDFFWGCMTRGVLAAPFAQRSLNLFPAARASDTSSMSGPGTPSDEMGTNALCTAPDPERGRFGSSSSSPELTLYFLAELRAASDAKWVQEQQERCGSAGDS